MALDVALQSRNVIVNVDNSILLQILSWKLWTLKYLFCPEIVKVIFSPLSKIAFYNEILNYQSRW